MSELDDLYQQLVLDHYKRPRNYRKLADANKTAEGYNPLCGDSVNLYATVQDNVIKDIGFQGSGCAISKAAASLMTEMVKGKTLPEALVLFQKFQDMVMGHTDQDSAPAELGKLAVFAGVREFPVRVKCAMLSWHTLRAALEGKKERVSTE
jgi:nitrogen fixation NifU-like protein